MRLGDVATNLDVPIVGSDVLTVGFSPTTMHIDPVSGLTFAQDAANAQAAAAAASAPAATSGVPWFWLLLIGGVGWYAYSQGWFAHPEKLWAELRSDE